MYYGGKNMPWMLKENTFNKKNIKCYTKVRKSTGKIRTSKAFMAQSK